MTKLNPGSQSAPPFSLYLRIFLSICFYLFNFAFDYYSFRLQQKEQSRPSWPTSIQEVHLVLPSDTSQVHLRSLCFVFPYLYILDCYFWVFVQLFCAAPDHFDCRKSIWSSTQPPQKSNYAALFIFFLVEHLQRLTHISVWDRTTTPEESHQHPACITERDLFQFSFSYTFISSSITLRSSFSKLVSPSIFSYAFFSPAVRQSGTKAFFPKPLPSWEMCVFGPVFVPFLSCYFWHGFVSICFETTVLVYGDAFSDMCRQTT